MKEPCEHFVTCSPGLEPCLHQEVRGLGFSKVEQQVGGVRFIGKMRDAWRANLELRTAIRVLRRLERFNCPDEGTLYKVAKSIDWSSYLRENGSFFVDAQCRDSRLDHSQFVAQRTKDAVVDKLRTSSGLRPSVAKEDADLRIHVHIWKDRCTISVDTSGNSLHKRGWRKYQGYAPVAETIAAAMVLNSKWDKRAPLIDPFCGSGTVLVEGAMIAAKMPPGAFRSFGFEKWPGHRKSDWMKFKEAAMSRVAMPKKLRLIGNDLDRDHLAGMKQNVLSIGAADNFELQCGDARELEFKKGWGASVVANMPYGIRVGNPEELDDLYSEFGATLREKAVGYNFALLVGSRQFAHKLGFQKWDSLPIQNGSLNCRLILSD